MVSLYFNVFSQLSLSNLLPRVQLSNLVNNQNPNSLLNRFGLQDTVTDLLNRVGFDQTFSLGNKIGIDRPDSILNKLELGMNNVINVNQQGLLNTGQDGLGGLYGSNGPGGAGGGGGITGIGSYGGQAGVSGSGGGLLGGQGGWQGQTGVQGSFPIGGNFQGGGQRPSQQFGNIQPGLQGGSGSEGIGGGGIQNNNQAFANNGEQSNLAANGGILSGILSQVGNRFGWGSGNKNEPKDYYKQAQSQGQGEAWWINQGDHLEYLNEESHDTWLQESVRDVLENGRMAERQSEMKEMVLKYMVENQIKKIIQVMLHHLAELKVKPYEQVKINEAAETELRKLTPEQIKRIAHDIIEREKTKLNETERQKLILENIFGKQSDNNHETRVNHEPANTNENVMDNKNKVLKLLENEHENNIQKDQPIELPTNKTENNFKPNMSKVVQQLTENHSKVNSVKNDDKIATTASIGVDVEQGDTIQINNKTGMEISDSRKVLHVAKNTTAKISEPKLYISEKMRENINELLKQLSGHDNQPNSDNSQKVIPNTGTFAESFGERSEMETSTEHSINSFRMTSNREEISTTPGRHIMNANPAEGNSNPDGDNESMKHILERLFNTAKPIVASQQKLTENNHTSRNGKRNNRKLIGRGAAYEFNIESTTEPVDIPAKKVGVQNSPEGNLARNGHQKRELFLEGPIPRSRWMKRSQKKMKVSLSKLNNNYPIQS